MDNKRHIIAEFRCRKSRSPDDKILQFPRADHITPSVCVRFHRKQADAQHQHKHPRK